MSEHTSFDDEICRVFKKLDTDNLGTLDLKEISRSTKAKVFMQLDKKKDARIDLEENDIEELFKSVDANKSGFISLEELKVMLYHLDVPIKNAGELMKKVSDLTISLHLADTPLIHFISFTW